MDGQHLLIQGLNIADHDATHRVIFLWAHLGMVCEMNFNSSWMHESASRAGFACRSCSLFGTGICLGDAFSKEEEIPKRVSDAEFFETIRFGLQRRTNRMGRKILLV